MNRKLIIFDLDGTILETLNDLHTSLNYALSCFSLPARTLQEARSFIGNGIRRLIELSVPSDTPGEMVDRIHSVFLEHYSLHCNDETRPYRGILDVIRTLRKSGFLTAVVSNKDDHAVRQLCELHFPGLFDAVVGSRQNVRKKPAPDSVFSVLSQLNVSAAESVYIGDSEVDYHTALNAGMDLITVSWGFRDRDVLQETGCRIIVDTTDELQSLLMDQMKSTST